MRREGTDPDNVRMSDVLCDFCRTEWTEDLPMLEGHQGSCICAKCLSVAYAATHTPAPPSASPVDCRMCLEKRDDPAWISPVDETAAICQRCAELAAASLEKDPDFHWRRPGS